VGHISCGEGRLFVLRQLGLVYPQIMSTDLDDLTCKMPLAVGEPGLAAQRITSVAWKRRAGGMVSPSAFAILRVMTSVYRAGRSMTAPGIVVGGHERSRRLKRPCPPRYRSPRRWSGCTSRSERIRGCGVWGCRRRDRRGRRRVATSATLYRGSRGRAGPARAFASSADDHGGRAEATDGRVEPAGVVGDTHPLTGCHREEPRFVNARLPCEQVSLHGGSSPSLLHRLLDLDTKELC
jgi:hypothetical protein